MAAVLICAAVALLVGADQAIKLWAVRNLKGGEEIPFCPIGDFDWMHLRYLENDGAAFSILSGSRAFLITESILMILLCFYLLLRLARRHRYLYVALPLIMAGGIGNLIDRIFRGGHVIDYFDLQLFRFAVFNFADCCVTVGVAVLIVGLLFLEKELPRAKKLKESPRVPYCRRLPLAEDAEPAPTLETAPALEPAPTQDHVR